ncbi:MAG TPA: hypothetical protein VF440_14885 [Novosphingobium sp.]
MGTSYVRQAESRASGACERVPKPSGGFGNMGTEMAGPDAGKSARVWLPRAPSSRTGGVVTIEAHYAALAEVIEWRRNAAPGEWVSFAGGDSLDGKHPVVALVRGWQQQGLVEVASDTMPAGWQRHRFKRTRADFPAGWFDPPPARPSQPPALHDPVAVTGGFASMAHFSVQGDEHPDWMRFAALALADELAGPSPPSADAVFQASFLLRAVAALLDPAGDSARFAEIRWRRRGRQATGQRLNRMRAEQKAALAVVAAVAEGVKKDSAINAAAKDSGISEGRIKAWLGYFRRWERRGSDLAAIDAAQLVRAMTQGGLTQAAALEEIAAATGQERPAIRKALTDNQNSK